MSWSFSYWRKCEILYSSRISARINKKIAFFFKKVFKTSQMYPQTHHRYDDDGELNFTFCSEGQGHNNTVACLEKPQLA